VHLAGKNLEVHPFQDLHLRSGRLSLPYEFDRAPFVEFPAEKFDEIMRSNVYPPFFLRRPGGRARHECLGCQGTLGTRCDQFQDLFGLSLSLRWPRQCNPIENLADKKVSLNGGEVFSHDLIVEPQTKQASRVAWNFKLNDDPFH
jgi:hypothetical protein